MGCHTPESGMEECLLNALNRQDTTPVPAYSGLSEAYILRLETGQRRNPSRDVVIMLARSLVRASDVFEVWDIDELLTSASYTTLCRRGQRAGQE